MVIDASALVAILKGESEAKSFADAIVQAPARRLSPVNWFETAIAAQKGGERDFQTLLALIKDAEIGVVPVDAQQMRIAYEAWCLFGKGNHPAKLNMGDCFAYALARQTGEPLLYKGNDFSKTDVISAL